MPNDKPKRPRGRPPKDPSEHVQVIDLCLRPDQVEDYKALGGSKWVQKMIDDQRKAR